ncbi:conserved exported hypothetical protein [Candidatus Sulfopaludibacter sp. SbA3]|nr:conserved exported hypothetical protein [Candidatus Sulfopaludibacter sp. SbA3]
MMRARLLVLFLAAAGIACAAGHEFDDMVKAVETHFGATRTHIPLMGVANFVLKVAHPAGTSGFRIALFEDLKTDLDEEKQAELDRFMDGLSSPKLRPFIRTRSRDEGEATYIFCGETGKTTQMLLATFSRREATVIEVKVDFETLLRWIQSPELAGKSFKGDHERDW